MLLSRGRRHKFSDENEILRWTSSQQDFETNQTIFQGESFHTMENVVLYGHPWQQDIA
jgi:hypothetical protein